MTAVKKADRGNGTVVRFYEATGQAVSTPIRFLGRERNAREVNLLEEPGKSPEGAAVQVRPYEIETVEISPSRPASASKPNRR